MGPSIRGILLATLIGFLAAPQFGDLWRDGKVKLCGLTFSQGRKLQQYHGVVAWRCQNGIPQIKRNGRWISVMRNPREREVILYVGEHGDSFQ